METLNTNSSETLNQLQQHNGELPMGNSAVAPPEPEPQAVTTAPVESSQQEASDVVEVDGQHFATEKDARDYLQQKYSTLEQERLLDEARIEGMQSAMQFQPTNTAQEPPVDTDPEPQWDENSYYEDPAGYQRAYNSKHAGWLERKMERKWNAREAAANQEKEVWGVFSSENPDLVDFRDDVNRYVAENADTVRALVKRDPKKARDHIAMQVRAKFQRWVDTQSPTKVLSNHKAGPSYGGNPPVTHGSNAPVSSKPVDFAQQLRTMRAKG